MHFLCDETSTLGVGWQWDACHYGCGIQPFPDIVRLLCDGVSQSPPFRVFRETLGYSFCDGRAGSR